MASPNQQNPTYPGKVTALGFEALHAKGVSITVVASNGATPVSVFGSAKTDTVGFLPVITSILVIAKDATQGTITVAGTQGTVGTVEKGATANGVRGVSSLANASIALTDTLTIVSNSAGDVFALIAYKITGN